MEGKPGVRNPATNKLFCLTNAPVSAFFRASLMTRSTLLFGLALISPLAAEASTKHKHHHEYAHHSKHSSTSHIAHRSTHAHHYEAEDKLATSAADAIPATTSLSSETHVSKLTASMYDASSARKPSGDLLGWFGPRAAGVRYDSRMIHAAQIAEQRAHQHSIRSCWRYVKTALVEANVVQSYPKTEYAKQAGDELLRDHGFRRLPINDPFKAPIGSVLVYGGPGAGHVEIRTEGGFVSDFESATPSKRPLIGIYVKPAQG